MQTKKIVYFSKSQTTKKIIEYSLESCTADVEEAVAQVPKTHAAWALIIFDGKLLLGADGKDWEAFLLNTRCPLILLDDGLDPKSPLLKNSPQRRILHKPFERNAIMKSIQSLGLPFHRMGASKHTEDGERVFEGASSMVLPASFQEELRKEALAFVSDYCKSHFRNIAEDILVKEIRRLTEERNTYIDEAD